MGVYVVVVVEILHHRNCSYKKLVAVANTCNCDHLVNKDHKDHTFNYYARFINDTGLQFQLLLKDALIGEVAS